MSEIVKTPLRRFKWSHQLTAHRVFIKFINKIMRYVPFRIKYEVGQKLRKNKAPYSLLKGKMVVQIGSPHDTLACGRSRGMYFSLMTGSKGKVFIIEPDPHSVETFRETAKLQGITNTTVIHNGAWSESKTLTLYVDPNHPATNFSEGTVDYDDERLKEYEKVVVPVDTVDNIIKSQGLEQVDLVSITTNWAEIEILEGMKELIENGLQYICLAFGNPGTDYLGLLDGLGYEFYSYDDRGITFQRKSDVY